MRALSDLPFVLPEQRLGHHVLHDAHPVLYAVGAAGLALVLFVLLVVFASKTKGALVTPIVPALAAPLDTVGDDGPDPIPCSFALLGAQRAKCQRGGHMPFAAAGPSYFEIDTKDTGGTLAAAFVAIVTVGLVIPGDGSTHGAYTLVDTRRGPEGAPEALP